MSSDNIPPEKLTAWERWQLASFDEEGGSSTKARLYPKPAVPTPEPEAAPEPEPAEEEPKFNLPTASELEQIHQQAHDEGYQSGYAEGQQAASAETQRLASLLTQLETSMSTLNDEVAEELLSLALEIARQVMRQTIAQTPESILPVVREAISLLPHQHAAIYLHPDDASLVRSYLGEQLTHAGHRIHESPELARGDCRVETGNTQVDATLTTRWQRVVADLGISIPLNPASAPTPEP